MILCCGEALIDMIPAATATGEIAFVPHAGGSVFNTAIALGRLGMKPGMLSGLSTDLFGLRLQVALIESGVDTASIILSDRPTTLAFVHLAGGQATYTFYDENSAGRMIAPGDLPVLPPHVTALYFGGISLAVEPGAETYAALLEREGGTRPVMLDPNIRPGFIRDERRYRDRLLRMLSRSDIVKVSDDDLDWIYPAEDALAAKAERLRQAGPAIVIVTRGGEGCIAFSNAADPVVVPASQAQVVDTVGAGDTFNAGVLASLARQHLLSKSVFATLPAPALREALSFGARVAAITVSRAGADPPWANEL